VTDRRFRNLSILVLSGVPFILDIERVTKCAIYLGTLMNVQSANPCGVEPLFRDRHDVVALDNAGRRESFLRANLHFGINRTNCARDWYARDSAEHLNRRVVREHAYGSATSRFSALGPHDVATGYHAGAVARAIRSAASMRSGSCGRRR
jgi:hypothetical protein